MEADIAAQAAGDPVINQLIIGLVTDACSLTIQRVVRSARERTRRASRKVDVLEALRWDDRAFTPSIALLASVPELDADAVTVQSALTARRTRTVFQQVVACALLDEYESRRDELGGLLGAALNAHGLELSEVAAPILLDVIYQLTELALRNVTSSPQSAAIAEQAARTVLLQATIESIAADVAMLGRNHERDSDADKEWEQRYRTQCVRRHGVIIPPDNNKRTPVPLDEIYVPGRIGTSRRAADTLTVYDLAPDLDRHVILGDPGGGKSTATNALAHKIASDDANRIPFVVVLRDFAAVMHEESIAGYIQRTIASRYETSAPPEGLVERILRHGKAVVLLDGLDELLDPTKRGLMAEKVELFSNNYPSVAVLVTSRRVGYVEAQLDPTVFRAFELSAYTDEDVAAYVSKWFSLNASGLQLAPGTAVDDVVRAFLDESQSISDLRSNPLLLALLCIIYRGQNYLPRNRVAIYEKCTELLFETWDRSRGLVYDFAFDSYIDAALKHLAFWMFTNDQGGEGVTEEQLIAEIGAFFGDQAYETDEKAAEAAKAFIGFCKGRAWVLTETGLSPDDEPLFTFAHRTFLEFYAAAQVTRRYPDPEKLALQLVKRVSRSEWDTVGQLAIQLINRSVEKGAERAISKMLQSATAANRTLEYKANTLSFVAQCLQDLPPAPALLRLGFIHLTALVDDMFAGDRASAVWHQLEYSLAMLYRQDVTGESILLSEMRTYVGASPTSDETSFRAKLFVAKSCLRQGLTRDEEELFRAAFIDSWSEKRWLEFDSLRTAYFLGIMEVPDIAAKSLAVGGRPLDPWLVNMTASETPYHSGYHSMASSVILLDRIGSKRVARTHSTSGRRWFGSLANEIGEWLRDNAELPLASARSVDAEELIFSIDTPSDRQFELSSGQATAALVFACVFVEMLGPRVDDLIATFSTPGPLSAAREALTHGAWESPYFDQVEESAIKAWLRAWAEKGYYFVAPGSDAN